MKKNLIIFGAGGHARSILNEIDESQYESVRLATWGSSHLNSYTQDKIIHIPSIESFSPDSETEYFLGIGDLESRLEIASKLLKMNPNIRFASIISKDAVISKTASIGEGVFVGSRVFVGPNSDINNHVILNTASIVEHDCSIGKFTVLSPGTIIGGNTKIAESVFIGMGAIVSNGICIESKATIGAGSLVLKNIDSSTVNYGLPSRRIR